MAGGVEKSSCGEDIVVRMNRDEILHRFETWLDTSLASEEPPRGIDAELLELVTGGETGGEERHDSYAVWAAVTALTQEVRLQGRTFKELNDAVTSLGAERDREVQREAERKSRKEILGGLIDLRDRLGRGLESAAAASAAKESVPAAWRKRLFRKASDDGMLSTVAALRRGYELGLERLDQMLEEFNAREILCQGQQFDPYRMNAIDLEESNAVPEGTILEVYRSGYEWNGEVFRPAQVKVSRASNKGKPV